MKELLKKLQKVLFLYFSYKYLLDKFNLKSHKPSFIRVQ